ncbi:MAG: UTRA domain-containing protein [Pseudonocardiales bacterium]|nr:UTRA domain-containing protein [Pseudonocardiales bacterium]
MAVVSRIRKDSGTSNFNAEVAAQGRQATQRLLSVEEVPAPVEIAERLNVPPDTPLIVRRRLFVVDDQPMQLCDGYYPATIFRGTAVAEPRCIKGGVHAVIEDTEGPVRAKVTQFVEGLNVLEHCRQRATTVFRASPALRSGWIGSRHNRGSAATSATVPTMSVASATYRIRLVAMWYTSPHWDESAVVSA